MRRTMMKSKSFLIHTLFAAATAMLVVGCTRERAAENTTVVKPAAIVSGSRAVVEEYLRAAAKADGAGMYALIASSERKDETPQSLADTARDRYSPNMTW